MSSTGVPSVKPVAIGCAGLLAAALLFGSGLLVGSHSDAPAAESVAAVVPASSAVPVPSDAPVGNLVALRGMGPADQVAFLKQMTDDQLTALQSVAVLTPNVLPRANAEAETRGLPELGAGRMDSNGAVPAVPLDSAPAPLLDPVPPLQQRAPEVPLGPLTVRST